MSGCRRGCGFAAALLALAVSPPSQAEEAPVAVQEQAHAALQEVEHGGYTGGQIGVLFVKAPGDKGGLASGTLVGVNIGYDFIPWLGIGLFAWGGALLAPEGYGGLSGGATSGDFSVFLPGVEARLHLPLGADSNGVDRVYLDIGAGAGALFLFPRDLIVKGPVGAGKGDLGLEYFTHLRHLSLGLRVDGLYAPIQSSSALVALAVSPFVRYSF
jgi:hypothetical protein